MCRPLKSSPASPPGWKEAVGSKERSGNFRSWCWGVLGSGKGGFQGAREGCQRGYGAAGDCGGPGWWWKW